LVYSILWERACSRRGQYIQNIFGTRTIAFASKLAPTVFVGVLDFVGASLLAKRPVHPKHIWSPGHCLRKQACSHSFVKCTRLCGSELAREEASTSKTYLEPGPLPSQASLLPQFCEMHTTLWERACSRRGQYIQNIFGARAIALASKLASTETGSGLKNLHRSRIAVTPCPPAAQIEINPRPCPTTLSSLARLATIRPPVAANG